VNKGLGGSLKMLRENWSWDLGVISLFSTTPSPGLIQKQKTNKNKKSKQALASPAFLRDWGQLPWCG